MAAELNTLTRSSTVAARPATMNRPSTVTARPSTVTAQPSAVAAQPSAVTAGRDQAAALVCPGNVARTGFMRTRPSNAWTRSARTSTMRAPPGRAALALAGYRAVARAGLFHGSVELPHLRRLQRRAVGVDRLRAGDAPAWNRLPRPPESTLARLPESPSLSTVSRGEALLAGSWSTWLSRAGAAGVRLTGVARLGVFGARLTEGRLT